MTKNVQTTFIVDESTAQAIAELKKTFNVKTNAAVIRKALALAQVAAAASGDDKSISLIDKNNNQTKILLAG